MQQLTLLPIILLYHCTIYLNFQCYGLLKFKRESFDNFQSNLPKPIVIPITISESTIVKPELIDLSQLMISHGMNPVTTNEQFSTNNNGISNSKVNFEILDISTNLLTAYQQRGHTNFLNLIDLHPIKGVLRFVVPIDRERICNDIQQTDRECKINILIAAYKMNDRFLNNNNNNELICIDLLITILDVNDNAPYFPQLRGNDNQPKIITIQEECPINSMYSLPIAIDPDSAEHGIVKYEFHSISTPLEILRHFEIVQLYGSRIQCENVQFKNQTTDTKVKLIDKTITPCLKVISRLDRELLSRYTVRLVAVDANGKTGEIVLRIQLTDINDHSPQWPDKLETNVLSNSLLFVHSQLIPLNDTISVMKYTYKILECITHRQLLHLTATDEDSADTVFGHINYELDDQSMNNELIRQRLFISGDYLYLTDIGLRGISENNLTLIVTAKDGAGKSTNAWIELLIQDCNDHQPMILMRNTEFTLPENIVDNVRLISLITVRDLDLTSSPNSEFNCLLNDTNYLNLKQVMSGPKPVYSDNEPVGNDYNSKINSDMIQSNLKTVEHDHQRLSNQGRWAIYRLENQPQSPFDRELQAFYSVVLQCTDRGLPPLTSTRLLTIIVEDVNDNQPIFLNSEQLPVNSLLRFNYDPFRRGYYHNLKSMQHSNNKSLTNTFQFHVSENVINGATIGRIYAIDFDEGLNGQIIYEFIQQKNYFNKQLITTHLETMNNNNNINRSDVRQDGTANVVNFVITMNGDLQVITQLDREQVDYYELEIVIKDSSKTNPLSSTATIQIYIEDINDCKPEFDKEYVFEIVESYGSSTIHQMLATIEATDKDVGRNGTVSYRLKNTGDQNSRLEQNRNTPAEKTQSAHLVQISHDGKLTVYGVVDRERTPVIMVTVIAEDNGIPVRLSNSISITIHILDLNDNKPRFIESHSTDLTNDLSIDTNLKVDKSSIKQLPAKSLNTVTGFKLNLSLDTNVGTLLTVFEAYDPDNGPNGTVVFDLAYSGSFGSINVPFNPNNEITTAINSQSSENTPTPTFILQPDGRLLLSKRLTYSDMLSPLGSNLPRRYRRPDRLLIRASDQGPNSEHSITSLEIFYYDPIELIHNSLSPSDQNAANLAEYYSAFKNDFGNTEISNLESQLQDEQSHFQNKNIHNSDQFSRKLMPNLSPRSIGQSQTRGIGVPVMYMLALAVCLALVLVIVSFVCFYAKLRKSTVSNNANRDYDTMMKNETHLGIMPDCHKVDYVGMHMENTLSSNSKKDFEDSTSVTMNQPDLGKTLSPDFSLHTGHYGTLSPPFFLRGCGHQNTMPPNGSYVDTFLTIPRWTTDNTDYTQLPMCHNNNDNTINNNANMKSYRPVFQQQQQQRHQSQSYQPSQHGKTQTIQFSPDPKMVNDLSGNYKTQTFLYEDHLSPVFLNQLRANSTQQTLNSGQVKNENFNFTNFPIQRHISMPKIGLDKQCGHSEIVPSTQCKLLDQRCSSSQSIDKQSDTKLTLKDQTKNQKTTFGTMKKSKSSLCKNEMNNSVHNSTPTEVQIIDNGQYKSKISQFTASFV